MTGGKHGVPITPVGICSAMAPAIAPTMAADGIGEAPMMPHSAPTSEMWLVRSVILAAGSPIVRQRPQVPGSPAGENREMRSGMLALTSG